MPNNSAVLFSVLNVPTVFMKLPDELLLEIRSYIPDLFTHVSLSQTCRRLRDFYDDSDNPACGPPSRPGFFECALRKLGLNRSVTRPDGRGGEVPSWKSLAGAVAHHSLHCTLPSYQKVYDNRNDLRTLTLPRIIDPLVAVTERTLLSFTGTVNRLTSNQFESAGMFSYYVLDDSDSEDDAEPKIETPEALLLTKHITAASYVATWPPVTSFQITVDDLQECGIHEIGIVANEGGVTCFDAIQGLCDMLGGPFDPSRREMAIQRHFYEKNNSAMTIEAIRMKYEQAAKVCDVFKNNRSFRGFRQVKSGHLATQVRWNI